VDDFPQHVAMFVFSVSNALFFQVFTLQTYTEKQTSSGKNQQLRFTSPLRDPLFDRSPPFFGFWSILWKPQD